MAGDLASFELILGHCKPAWFLTLQASMVKHVASLSNHPALANAQPPCIVHHCNHCLSFLNTNFPPPKKWILDHCLQYET